MFPVESQPNLNTGLWGCRTEKIRACESETGSAPGINSYGPLWTLLDFLSGHSVSGIQERV